jgi:hypothetical protein
MSLSLPSTFTWLDVSERERRRALDAIRLFREQDTRDELGLGTIRDAFANLFSPGTTTIQTRARYFLFIPWIYLGIEHWLANKTATPSEIGSRARRDEVALIEALVAGGETDGVIGIEARRNLQRLPSAIYWQGLAAWRILRFPGSQDQYHRLLARLAPIPKRRVVSDEEGEKLVGPPPSWLQNLPGAPEGFLKEAHFALTLDEAHWLGERIISTCQGTLLAWLVDRGKQWESVDFPWVHPQFGSFPEVVQERLLHGREFSEAMHGAALLYNLMLAESRADSKLKEAYREALEEWALGLRARAADFARWDRRRFWVIVDPQGSQISSRTKRFVNDWLDLSLGPRGAGNLADADAARALVHERERQLKGGRARLTNPHALGLWSGAAGTHRLDYRWRVTQRIVLDIIEGCGRGR